MKKYVLLTLTLIAGAVAVNPVTAAGNIAGNVQAQAATEVKTGFSPGGTALNLVLDSIDHAQHEILVAAYSLTSRPVAGALRAAKKTGRIGGGGGRSQSERQPVHRSELSGQ